MNDQQGRLPNFLYIGPDKAGSSWLHEVLLHHPQMYLTEAKDLYFFDRYYDRGLDWYRAQFRRAGPQHSVVGEVCQDYLFHPDAASRIHRDLGAARLMVTLREPAARAFSSYLYMRKHGEPVGTFREALDTRPELLAHSAYGAALERYLALFRRRDLHVAFFDDLQESPQVFIDDITDWLGLDRLALTEEQLRARLPASSARSAALARLVRRAAVWAREHNGATVVGRVKRSEAVQRVLYRPLEASAAHLQPADRDLVWQRLADDLDLLTQLTGIDARGRWDDSSAQLP